MKGKVGKVPTVWDETWEWLATDCVMDTVPMAAFFGDEDNMSKGWSPDGAL